MFLGILALGLIAAVLAIAGVFKSSTQPYQEPDIRTVSGTPLSSTEVNQLISSYGLEGRLIRENLPPGFARTASLATNSGDYEVISATDTKRDLGFRLTSEGLLQAIALLEELTERQPLITEEVATTRHHPRWEKVTLRLVPSSYSSHVLVFPGWLGDFDSWSSAGPGAESEEVRRGTLGEWTDQDVRKANYEYMWGRQLFSLHSFEYEVESLEEEAIALSYEPEVEPAEVNAEKLLNAQSFYELLCQVVLQAEPASVSAERLRHRKPIDPWYEGKGNMLAEVSETSMYRPCSKQGAAMANAASSMPMSYEQYVENVRSQYTPPSAAELVSANDYERFTERLAP